MTSLKTLWVRLVKDEEGATMIEYALLAALISIVAITAITGVGKQVDTNFKAVETALKPVAPPA
jgi:pilus assembly protein Flp/PilA